MNEILGCVAFCTILFSVTFAFFPMYSVLKLRMHYPMYDVMIYSLGGGEERWGGSTVDETLAM